MAKPTLMQALFNQPSQSYPPLEQASRDYYSAKPELLRIARQADAFSSSRRSSIALSFSSHHQAQPRQRRLSAPDPSPRYVSSPLRFPATTSSLETAHRTPLTQASEERSDSDDTDTEDVFHTPNTSPRASMDGSLVTWSNILDAI